MKRLVLVFILLCYLLLHLSSCGSGRIVSIANIKRAFPDLTIYSVPDNKHRYIGVSPSGIVFEIRMHGGTGASVKELVLLDRR